MVGLRETPLPIPQSISEPVLGGPAAMPAGAPAQPETRG
jgi:ubiquinol-cytochrome c reductase cytochrome b subunit